LRTTLPFALSKSSLSNNQIADKGALALAGVLQKNVALQKLE
jgi:hypothetical protein